MIDLHCHMLPGIDDGARDVETALEMARMAVADGIEWTACTPHIYPGVYENRAPDIQAAVDRFRRLLEEAGIPLKLTFGADIQLVPELVASLSNQDFPTLHGTRYFLFEPPHHVAPAHFLDILFDALAAGYIPLITHPERLTWLDEEHYPWFLTAARQGAWIQLTAGAVTGRFGRRPRYWAERMLGEGLVHLLATDAHDTTRRPPALAEGRVAAERWVGPDEAERLVSERPRAVLDNRPGGDLRLPPGLNEDGAFCAPARKGSSWWPRWLGGRG